MAQLLVSRYPVHVPESTKLRSSPESAERFPIPGDNSTLLQQFTGPKGISQQLLRTHFGAAKFRVANTRPEKANRTIRGYTATEKATNFPEADLDKAAAAADAAAWAD